MESMSGLNLLPESGYKAEFQFLSEDSFKQFVSGTVGGMAGLVVGHPMDTIKVLMHNSSTTPTFSGITNIIRQSGANRFFSGLPISFYSYGFVNAIIFTTYKQTLNYLDKSGESAFANMIAGGAAGLIQLIPAVPIDIIKIQQQNQSVSKIITTRECIRTILRVKGITGLYTGSVVQLFRDVPGFMTYFYGYSEFLKVGHSIGLSTFWSAFFGGAMGGALSWCISLPFDVIKTRQQSVNGKSMLGIIHEMLNEKKMTIFFRGFHVVIIRALLVNACTFAVYETFYKYLTNLNSQTHTTRN